MEERGDGGSESARERGEEIQAKTTDESAIERGGDGKEETKDGGRYIPDIKLSTRAWRSFVNHSYPSSSLLHSAQNSAGRGINGTLTFYPCTNTCTGTCMHARTHT
jgi:hypothetical protein